MSEQSNMAIGFGIIFVIGSSIIAMEMFEFVLWIITGFDAPWYLDFLGGIVTNGFLFAAWVICLILRAVGVEIPLIQ